ncbi:MAG: hypothetical protein ACKVOB_03710 [Sphingomonas sp.]
MTQSGKDGFWSRFWAAAPAMENQYAEQADVRLAAVEREIAELKQDRQDERGPDTSRTTIEHLSQSTTIL